MSKQYNKAIKRQRRQRYIKRKKKAIKAKKAAGKPTGSPASEGAA